MPTVVYTPEEQRALDLAAAKETALAAIAAARGALDIAEAMVHDPTADTVHGYLVAVGESLYDTKVAVATGHFLNLAQVVV